MSDGMRILVVDDDPQMARTLKDILTVRGRNAGACNSGAEALELLAGGQIDCVLTDIKMPEMNGVELLAEIKRRWPDLPVVLMTAYTADDLVKEGLGQGAAAALSKPLNINSLLSIFSAIGRERTLLIVDDDPAFTRTMADILRLRGFAVTEATDPHQVMENLRADEQVVLLDMKLNSISGLDILKGIRVNHAPLPVILVTGYRQETDHLVKACFELDALTCLFKPVKVDELMQVFEEIRRRELRGISDRGDADARRPGQ